MIFLIF